jgi:hypothetical protein
MLRFIHGCEFLVEVNLVGKTLPPLGKGDHDIVLCDTLITPNRVKKPRRNILLWKKADRLKSPPTQKIA